MIIMMITMKISPILDHFLGITRQKGCIVTIMKIVEMIKIAKMSGRRMVSTNINTNQPIPLPKNVIKSYRKLIIMIISRARIY